MGRLEESQCLKRPPEGTVAELRHPSPGRRDPYRPQRNPLLWRLGAYRTCRGVVYSQLVVKFALFGFGLSSVTVILAIALPRHFSAQNFNFLSAMVVSAHVFWASASLWRRIQSWRRSSFLDELMLTHLSAQEISTALAHATARPIGASFLGAMVPIALHEAWTGSFGGTSGGGLMIGNPLLVWPILGAFVLLALFALPWISMSIAWNPCAVRHWPLAVVIGWIAVPPWLALNEEGFAPLAIGLFALVAIQLGMLNSRRVAGFLENRQ